MWKKSVKWKIVDKLVFIHSNIRLLARFSDSYKFEPHKKWDINLESTYIEYSSSWLEEIILKNLDEENVENGERKRQRIDVLVSDQMLLFLFVNASVFELNCYRFSSSTIWCKWYLCVNKACLFLVISNLDSIYNVVGQTI